MNFLPIGKLQSASTPLESVKASQFPRQSINTTQSNIRLHEKS